MARSGRAVRVRRSPAANKRSQSVSARRAVPAARCRASARAAKSAKPSALSAHPGLETSPAGTSSKRGTIFMVPQTRFSAEESMNRTIAAVALAGFFGTFAPAAASAQAPTFSKDVAPILYKNCTNCHRPGEIGPMPLVTYKDARPWAKSIATRVANGTMPPWHADPSHGQFLNDRSLKAADRDALLKWANGGAPEGKPTDLPAVPKFVEGWQMGQPDAVFTMQEDYPIPASGTIDYKYFDV